MADGGGLDLLREWQSAMTSVIPRQLLGPLKRQTELIGDVLERGIKTLREPADLARSAAGLEKRPAERPKRKKK